MAIRTDSMATGRGRTLPGQRADYWSQYQPATAPASSPASGASAPAGGGTPAMTIDQAIAQYQQQNPYGGAASYEAMFPYLQSLGFQVERPTRAGGTALSDDKIVDSRTGRVYDVITDVDGPGGGRWGMSDAGLWRDGAPVPGSGPAGHGSGGFGPGGLPPGYEMGTYTGGGMYPLASVMGPGLMQPWTTPFARPELSEETSPGYRARMNMGREAIERSAAARGTLRTGGTLKDLTQYGQDYGSAEYDKVYGRALGEYQMAHGIYDRNQANQFNRLYSMSNLGQNAAAMSANQGSTFANNMTGLYGQRADSQAAGTVGAANAAQAGWNAVGNLGMTISDYIKNRKPPVAAA